MTMTVKAVAILLCVFSPFCNAQFADSTAPTLPVGWDFVGSGVVGEADDRFLDSSAPNGGDGSLANPWNSLNDVTGMGTGYDLYLKTGSVFEDQTITIDWSGTATNRVVVASYCIRDGVAIRWAEGASGCGAKAEINGNFEPSCASAGTCLFAEAGAVPVNQYAGLVEVAAGAQYVTIQSLLARDSHGVGIKIDEGRTTPSYGIIEDSETYLTGSFGIEASRLVDGSSAIIRRNYVEEASVQWVYGYTGTWPACLGMNSFDTGPTIRHQVLMEYNIVNDCAGEGLSMLRINAGIMHNNTVSNTRRPLIYPDDARNIVIEQNLLVGTGFQATGPGNTNRGYGASLTNPVEGFGGNTYPSVENLFRNNISVNTQEYVFAMQATISDPEADGIKIGAKFYGNTTLPVNSGYRDVWEAYNYTGNNNLEEFTVRSNIFGRSGSGFVESDPLVDFDYNAWEVTPEDPDMGLNANDVLGDIDIDIIESNYGGWDYPANIPDPLIAAPGPNSVALGAGDPSLETAVCLDASVYGTAFTNMNNGNPPTQANWEKCLYYDFAGNVRNATAPNAGALEVLSDLPPAGLDCTTNACYFAGTGGNDSNDGRTHATRWASLTNDGSINTTGADLYLLSGSVFEDQTLDVDWGGTSSNRVVVSTYCMNGSTATAYTQDGTGCGERAEINGTWEADCVATNNCQVGAGEVPSSVYAPLVGIARVNGENLDYITVSSLRLTESAGGGLQNAALVNDTDKSIGIIIEDNVIHDMAFTGILFTKVDNSIARNNELYHLWACEKQTRTGGDATCDDAQPQWGGCLNFQRSPNAQSLIENNWIHSSICEGISITLSDHVVVRGNSISNVHSSSIYGNHSANNVVENNITVGNRGGNEWWAPSSGFATGFDGIGSWALEANGQGTPGGGNLVRNNMTAGNQKCWAISNFNGTDPTDVQGADYYGNTCIGPISNGPVMAEQNPSWLISSQSSSNVIEVGAETACYQDSASDMNWSYNVWDVAQGSLDNDCEGANDVYSATIGLASTIGEAQAFNWVNFPTAADFELTSSSDAIGAGDPSLETEVCLDATDFGVGYTGINNGNPPNAANWEKCLYWDFDGNVRNATAPDAGALELQLEAPYIIVSTDGTDSASCGTLVSPCRNPEYAVQNRVSEAGTTVYLREGTYTNHDSDVAVLQIGQFNTINGSPDAYNTVRSYPGETAVLDGQDTATYVVEFRTRSYWVLRDLEIKEAKFTGLRFTYQSGDISVSRPGTTNIKVLDNYIHHNGNDMVANCGDGGGRNGMFWEMTSDVVTIDGNTFETNGRTPNPDCDNNPAGEHNYRHDHHIYAQGRNATITNNVFIDALAGYSVKMDGFLAEPGGYPEPSAGEFTLWIVNNTFGPITNPNVSSPNNQAFIRPFVNDPPPYPDPDYFQWPNRWYVANNVFLDPGLATWGLLTYPQTDTQFNYAFSGYFKDNYCGYSLVEASSDAAHLELCEETTAPNATIASIQATENLTEGLALSAFNFVDAAGKDYRIQTGSVAAGAGNPNAEKLPTYDKDGNIRPSPPSAGAYEVQ